MMKLEKHLIQFISNPLINSSELARVLELNGQTFKPAFMAERGLPEIHLYKILEQCVKLGFTLNGWQVKCNPETQSIVLIKYADLPIESEEIVKFNDKGQEMSSYFVYKEPQYRRFIDEFDLYNDDF